MCCSRKSYAAEVDGVDKIGEIGRTNDFGDSHHSVRSK
jgi:hypothetical protein